MSSRVNRLVGLRLRLARKRAGLSALEMAVKLNVDPFDYRKLETGQMRLEAPEMQLSSRIAGMPLSWFFVGYSEDESLQHHTENTANDGNIDNIIEVKWPVRGARAFAEPASDHLVGAEAWLRDPLVGRVNPLGECKD